MKKLISFLLILMFALPIVMARELEIEDIKWYINDDRRRGIEYSGQLEVNPSDEVGIKVGLFNNGNETIEEILVLFEIKDVDDGDDIEEEIDEFNLGDGDDTEKRIELDIPSDAENGIYNMFIKIRGIVNNTEELSIYNYTLRIYRDPVDISNILVDINKSLSNIKAQVAETYSNASSMIELNSKLVVAEDDRDEWKVKSEEKDTIITNKDNEIESKKDDIERLGGEKIILKNENTVLLGQKKQIDLLIDEYDCSTKSCIDKHIQDIEDNNTFMTYAILIIGGGAFWYYRKNLLPKTSAAGQPAPLDRISTYMNRLRGK